MESFWRDFGSNVFSGLKLAAFMRVRAENIRPSWSQLVALIAFGATAGMSSLASGIDKAFSQVSTDLGTAITTILF